jgi:hypothetical protein
LRLLPSFFSLLFSRHPSFIFEKRNSEKKEKVEENKESIFSFSPTFPIYHKYDRKLMLIIIRIID